MIRNTTFMFAVQSCIKLAVIFFEKKQTNHTGTDPTRKLESAGGTGHQFLLAVAAKVLPQLGKSDLKIFQKNQNFTGMYLKSDLGIFQKIKTLLACS